jgi:hypothetical protein
MQMLTMIMIDTMLPPNFVNLYADFMRRESEWRGSDQYGVSDGLFDSTRYGRLNDDSLIFIMVNI